MPRNQGVFEIEGLFVFAAISFRYINIPLYFVYGIWYNMPIGRR